MSTDRLRWPLVLLSLLVIAGLGAAYTSMAMALPDGVRACLADPAAHDGAELVFPVYFVDGVDGPQRYRISRVVKDIVVEGDSAGLERGQSITVVGRFRAADSVVVETRHEVHHLRPWKKRLSLLALVLAGVLAPRVFSLRGGYLRLRGLEDPLGGRAGA